ncbi:MAG: hypothetical protein JWP12_624 [Bacteroidetes bacterium]|nr:hypothetical protein [Bacteroidota bacterium]
MTTTCLTYEQLQAYSTHTVKTAERERLYMHISSCELCACAVNGFAAIAFTSDELVAIHKQIDAKTNATAAKPLTFAQYLIMFVSLVAIAGFYKIADRPYNNNLTTHPAALTTPTALIPDKNETKNQSAEEISAVTKTFKKIVNVIQYKKFERTITPVEQLEMIKPIAISSSSPQLQAVEEEEMAVAPHYDANVIYIYDLKVADYNKLYFNYARSEANLFSSHTFASKENKESAADEFGPELHSIPADRVLKEGLAAFNKQEFSKAIEKFNLLLENNPKDVNAGFYSALAYYNMSKVNKAIEQLNVVLQNPDQAFYPEAQWYLALVTLKTDKEKAKQMLETIVSEKGFYSKRAKEKLKVTNY